MIACHFFRRLAIGVIFLPYLSIAQSNYVWSAGYPMDGAGKGVVATIPLNEVNIHAYKHFYKHWPSVEGEIWSRVADGFAVTFMERSVRNRVFFNTRGRLLCALKYYPGEDISPELADMVYKKYPGYTIKVVTEMTDRNKTFYLVNIRNRAYIKNLFINDGKIELRDEMINGDPTWH